MAIVVESTSTTNYTSGSSVVITKPTGLAVGDLMLAATGGVGNTVTMDVASGWTNLSLSGTGAVGSIRLQYKVATSGDVAASNFTFTGSGTSVDHIAGAMFRITGYATNQIASLSDSDSDGTDGTTGTFTSTLTPIAANSLAIILYTAYGTNGVVPSITGFGSTPSLTYTTLLSTGVDSGTTDPAFGVGYGTYTGTSQFTQYTGSVSRSQDTHLGILYILTPQVDSSGSNTLATTTSQAFAQSGTCDTTTSNTLTTATATALAQSGIGTEPTVWTLTAKP